MIGEVVATQADQSWIWTAIWGGDFSEGSQVRCAVAALTSVRTHATPNKVVLPLFRWVVRECCETALETLPKPTQTQSSQVDGPIVIIITMACSLQCLHFQQQVWNKIALPTCFIWQSILNARRRRSALRGIIFVDSVSWCDQNVVKKAMKLVLKIIWFLFAVRAYSLLRNGLGITAPRLKSASSTKSKYPAERRIFSLYDATDRVKMWVLPHCLLRRSTFQSGWRSLIMQQRGGTAIPGSWTVLGSIKYPSSNFQSERATYWAGGQCWENCWQCCDRRDLSHCYRSHGQDAVLGRTELWCDTSWDKSQKWKAVYKSIVLYCVHSLRRRYDGRIFAALADDEVWVVWPLWFNVTGENDNFLCKKSNFHGSWIGQRGPREERGLFQLSMWCETRRRGHADWPDRESNAFAWT